MWAAFARSGIYLAALTFMMWVTAQIIAPIVDMAKGGPHSGAPSVSRVGGYFDALTVDNLVLLAALAVGIYLLGRAAVERQLG